MTENDPPTMPGQPSSTPTRWQRLRTSASRRPSGRAAGVLIGLGGFVLGLVVAGVLLLATPLGGGFDGGHRGDPDRVAAQGPDGRGGPDGGRGPDGGPGRGGPGRGPDGGPGRGGPGAGAAGGPVIQVQPGGTVIVQPGATVQQQAAPGAAAGQAPAPAAPNGQVPAPAAPNGQAPAPAAPTPTG